ncbi:MAG: hypothetical protein KF833_11450 [Verrucomicrobiae bacterium]|nr:hypothetical protein [Verrucomicrobiae bacterium]
MSAASLQAAPMARLAGRHGDPKPNGSHPAPSAPSAAPAHRVPASPVPAALAFLRDAIDEVAFAHHFLASHEQALVALSPDPAEVLHPPTSPETPAQRADRLLHAHRLLERRVLDDLARVELALESLHTTGVAHLESSVAQSRQTLLEQVIAPSLAVLQLDQDGGVESPFKHLRPADILDLLLRAPDHEERAMHEAERLLRQCPAVRQLKEDHSQLVGLRDEPGAREAIDDAARTAESAEHGWHLPCPAHGEVRDVVLLLDRLNRLRTDLRQRQDHLAQLEPRLRALSHPAAALAEPVESLVLARFTPCDATAGSTRFDPDGLAALFGEDSPLRPLIARHGGLPVGQVLRETVARAIDRLSQPAPDDPVPLDPLADRLRAFVRTLVRHDLLQDPPFTQHLTGWMTARVHFQLGSDLAAVLEDLRGVHEPDQHPILPSPAAAERVEDTVNGLPAADPTDATASRPVVDLLNALSARLRAADTPIDASELEFLLEAASDYVRRRLAFEAQSADRSAYVARAWTAAGRQRRMLRDLGEERPNAVQLAQIDAELSEAFEVLQADLIAFPNPAESPLTRACQTLRSLADEVAALFPPNRARLSRPGRRSTEPDAAPTALSRMASALSGRLEASVPELPTIASLTPELERIVDLAVNHPVPPEATAAAALARKAGIGTEEVARLVFRLDETEPLPRLVAADLR